MKNNNKSGLCFFHLGSLYYVEYKANDPERGGRDLYGAQLEPDTEGEVDIIALELMAGSETNPTDEEVKDKIFEEIFS